MKRVLPVIVLSQFFCTSLWFAGNAVISDMARDLQLDASFLTHLTSAVQFGFISGTMVFALLAVADRFSPSKVFFASSLLAGMFNLAMVVPGLTGTPILLLRFATGFFLAGIYPVGMKIASDHFREGLGRSLGFLVGALVLGTAFPHLLRSLSATLPWKYVVFATTLLSFTGGLCMRWLVPDGPYRKRGAKLQGNALLQGFQKKTFRSVAFGYFGHMWELYTFWAFVPVMLTIYQERHEAFSLNIPLTAFGVIAAGAPACVLGGWLSRKIDARKLATVALSLSGLCCLLSPLFLLTPSLPLFLSFLFFWAVVVIADSPLFSSLVARYAPEESRGTALTIVNCIGFSITIISIQFVGNIREVVPAQWLYTFLAIGPVLGLIALFRFRQAEA